MVLECARCVCSAVCKTATRGGAARITAIRRTCERCRNSLNVTLPNVDVLGDPCYLSDAQVARASPGFYCCVLMQAHRA